MANKVEVKITANTTEFDRAIRRANIAIRQAAKGLTAFNDAWERSLRRSRRLRFGGTRRHRIARLWWRLWYRWVDWRTLRRAKAKAPDLLPDHLYGIPVKGDPSLLPGEIEVRQEDESA